MQKLQEKSEEIKKKWYKDEIEQVEKELKGTVESMDQEKDAQMLELLREEEQKLEEQKTKLREELEFILSPKDPLDKKDIIVEIRGAAGGEESALFAAELFRMYSRFAEKRGWRTKLLSSNRTSIGGFKEVIFEISGKDVYSNLKYESGVHRVQRVPDTEKSGRVHTSTATVAVLPRAEEIDLQIKQEDLKIETSTARGHGGQSVNTTYSAIRITHLATGMMVSCQDERSQQQNREKALMILRSRLLQQEREKRMRDEVTQRRTQIGTGDRSEKIRTYNFSQDRVTDHRLEKNFHNIKSIMDGEIDEIIKELQKKL